MIIDCESTLSAYSSCGNVVASNEMEKIGDRNMNRNQDWMECA